MLDLTDPTSIAEFDNRISRFLSDEGLEVIETYLGPEGDNVTFVAKFRVKEDVSDTH